MSTKIPYRTWKYGDCSTCHGTGQVTSVKRANGTFKKLCRRCYDVYLKRRREMRKGG